MVPRLAATSSDELDLIRINTIRMLAVDAVQQSNSGHPGMPMDSASMAYVLWTRHLRFNPRNPGWPNRDRFVLSAGHGSMLLYSLLHLTGYDLSLDDIRNFRQWGSRTPGHPEYGHTAGVEVTTGPLGQGFSHAVGMAIAEAHLAARYNRPGHQVVENRTYVIASDGDFMEGVASEAASLAGHLKLGRLVVLYSDNRITIEGSTDLAFTEDVGDRFRAYDWHVQRADGNSIAEVDEAIRKANAETTRPSLIVARTHIGYGSPNRQDTSKAHGEPLGDEETRLTKENLGWPLEPAFYIPDEALQFFREAVGRGAALESEWEAAFARYAGEYPELAADLRGRLEGRVLPEGWDAEIPQFPAGPGLATRAASGKVLNSIAKRVPALVGGSADLAGSNNTHLDGESDLQAESMAGRNMRFGVREHSMGAVLNGMALSKAFIPYGGTFLVFSDFMKPAIRLAALMGQHVVYVFTHDSIGLGEDGPTHQPIEQLASLRSIPNVLVIRPSDANETAEAWRVAASHTGGPVALVLTRQKVATVDRTSLGAASGLANGAYVLREAEGGTPDVILIGTGSEVNVALGAAETLASSGVKARVVSMPSWELFDRQPADYRESILPSSVTARVSVEAAAGFGWERYVGSRGRTVSMAGFGASAPIEDLVREFGFTAENVASVAKEVLAGS